MTDERASAASAYLNSIRTGKRKRASQQNGAKGGRPKGSADSYKRVRRANSAKSELVCDPEFSQEG